MCIVYDYFFSKVQKFVNSETDLATLLSGKGLWTKNQEGTFKSVLWSLFCVIHKLCRKMENYAELGAKRARFSVSPIYFVFSRYTLKLEGAQILTARSWQSWI